MLHIFLVILKIIGIILAVLLGIIILLVLCVLFWPVRYRVEGQHIEQWRGRARVNYLGPIVWLSVLYQEEISYKLRICGIPVLSSDKKEDGDSLEECSSKGKKSKDKKKRTSAGLKRTSILDEEEEPDDLEPISKKTEELQSDNETEEQKSDNEAGNSKKDAKPGICEKIRKLRQSVIDKVRSIWEKIKDIFRLLCNIKETLEDEGVQAGIRTLKSEVWLLLKKIKPRKLKWYVKFGFEDPSTTGQLLAFLAALQGIWGREMHVEPDFENKVLETEFKLKGFIQGFRLVRLGWKCYFDKDIKYLFDKASALRRS